MQSLESLSFISFIFTCFSTCCNVSIIIATIEISRIFPCDSSPLRLKSHSFRKPARWNLIDSSILPIPRNRRIIKARLHRQTPRDKLISADKQNCALASEVLLSARPCIRPIPVPCTLVAFMRARNAWYAGRNNNKSYACVLRDAAAG